MGTMTRPAPEALAAAESSSTWASPRPVAPTTVGTPASSRRRVLSNTASGTLNSSAACGDVRASACSTVAKHGASPPALAPPLRVDQGDHLEVVLGGDGLRR